MIKVYYKCLTKQHRTLLYLIIFFRLNAHLPVSDATVLGYSGRTEDAVTAMIGDVVVKTES